jgi:phosphoglycerate dehydrogenase-like enzyme
VTDPPRLRRGASRLVVRAELGPYRDVVGKYLGDLLAPHDVAVSVLGDGDVAASGSEVLLTLPVDGPTIERCLSAETRWVHVLAAGVDGFPFELIGERLLTCSRGASAPAISEFVLAAMLAFEKRLPDSWVLEPPPLWGRAELGGLEGRALGLIGLGAIGVEVARRAVAFDMEVLALRRTGSSSSIPAVNLVSSITDLVERSDHVVLAAPATPLTRHLVDRDVLRAMKPGTHLVNIARGSLIDQEALREALDDGRVALATLDVADPEPLPRGHFLYSHPRVRLSPHISWSSPASTRRTFELFVENVERYVAGEPLTGSVDISAGY